MTNQPHLVTVRELFDGSRRFRVPIYQRSYAWGKAEIETLFRDVVSVLDRPHYYIGSLVVHEVRDADSAQPLFDVIDGQQRLTTLFVTLAHPAVRAHLSSLPTPFQITDTLLTFEERKRSNLDLATLSRPAVPHDAIDYLHDDGIRAGAEIVGNVLEDGSRFERQLVELGVRWSDSGSESIVPALLAYLLDRVQVVVTELPRETDLNHYFEVMNTRGEQLEKHEIVKAHLLGLIGEDAANRALLATVWDACSDFSRHVQARFGPPARSAIFGDPDKGRGAGWSSFLPTGATDLARRLATGTSPNPTTGPDLDQILTGSAPSQTRALTGEVDDGDAGRYGAIIDFPNFLLHVLRLAVAHDGQEISLDDKKLVIQFKRTIRDATAALDFAFRLLRAKFLFDNFVIKPLGDQGSNDDSNWVIHRQHHTKPQARSAKLTPRNAFGDLNPQVLMLQAMYQVTHQRRVYKEFLYDLLSWLDQRWARDQRIDGEAFIRHMHQMADRDLAALELDHGSNLDSGTGVPHIAFNLLDYKLWLFSERKRGELPPDLPSVVASGFRFAYRTSVEHFLPLNLAEGEDRVVANRLGNLCLMTREENSRRSDHTPDWKVAKYGTTNQSLKFHFMAALQRREDWHAAQISQQGIAMRRVLLTRLNDVADDPLLAVTGPRSGSPSHRGSAR